MKKNVFISALLTILAVSVAGAQQTDPALMALINEKNSDVLQQKLSALGSSKIEKDILLLSNYYQMKGYKSKSDSLQNIALALYPKGQIAAQRMLEQLFQETNIAKKESLLAQYNRDFPDADPDGVYGAMVYTMAKDKETCSAAIKYFEKIKGKGPRLTYAYHLGVNMALHDSKQAEPFLFSEIEEFKDIETKTGNAESNQQKHFLLEMKYAYGKILFDKGLYQQALPFIKYSYENGASRDIDKNVQYARVLIKLNDYQNAFSVLDQLIKSGKGNAELKQELVSVYTKLHPGKDGPAYVAGVEKEVNAQITKDYLKHVMNTPSPSFAVKDIDGKDVTLADFKGKTIVVDFWATWCGPCKKSFPAMQIAVNKYINDPDVKFLFIHTWEHTQTPLEDAQAYLNSNNYTFDLYIDPKDESKNSSKAADLFGVKSIPRKFIIDGKGIIRFNVGGFGGGDDAAVEELTNMIEYAKKSK
jgi:thiol-disulfide isomerase/thioredoxin